MSHKIYTTYLSRMKYIPKGTMKAIIMRFPPFVNEGPDVVHIPELSPTNELFKKYKGDHDWDYFEKEFQNQIETNQDTMEYLDLLIENLDDPNGNDVCLICCEKDNTLCHRRLIAEYLKFLGYEWEEI